jgi:hypothetical protein
LYIIYNQIGKRRSLVNKYGLERSLLESRKPQ